MVKQKMKGFFWLCLMLLGMVQTVKAEFRDFAIADLSGAGSLITSDEWSAGQAITFGIALDQAGGTTRVAADAENAIAVITGKPGNNHGLQNFSATVPVDGSVKITMSTCSWGNNVTVTNSANTTVASFTTKKGEGGSGCYKGNGAADENIVSTKYVGDATILTITGGGFVGYFAVEAVTASSAEVSYSLGNVECQGTIVPTGGTFAVGDSYTIPSKNFTLYKEGYTLTGWSDGTNTYANGATITLAGDLSLTPVFTQNTVSLADRTEAVTLKYDFQRNNGAPTLNIGGNTTGVYVTQATINGKTIDVKLDFNTKSSGKIANGNWGDWCQINNGTTFTVPSCQGATVSVEGYNNLGTGDGKTYLTIDGHSDYTVGKTVSYEITNTAETVDVVMGNEGSYYRYIQVVLPVVQQGGETTGKAGKVHTLGDSTMAPYDENVTNTRGWGMYFGNFLTNGWTSINYAKGGRDSRAGYNELWQNAKNNVEAGDYVLIQFAHNDTQFGGMDNLELQAYYESVSDTENLAAVKKDGRGTTPSTTYKACLKQTIDAVREKGAIPVLVSSVCRCYFTNGVAPITRAGRHDMGDKYQVLTANGPVNGTKLAADDHTMDFRYQMEQLAQEENVAFIDMTTATKELYESYGTYDKCYAALFDKGAETDNTHYNLTGALTAARLCAELMKSQGILADNIVIPTDLSISPSTVDLGEGYLGKTAMKELTLTGMGLDPATGTVTITPSEGIQLSTDKTNWSNSLEISYQNGSLIKTFYAKVNLTTAGQFNGTVTATQGSKSVEVPITINVVELGGGDPFTVNWTMSSTDKAKATVAPENIVTAADVRYEGLETYGYVNGYGALIAPTGSTGTWPTAAQDDQNQYVQFAITAPEGMNLDINSITMKIKAQGGGSLQCHAYYSTDGFVTRKTIFSSGILTDTLNEISNEDVIKVEEGDQLLIRVYPWSGNVDNGRWICISDVAIAGQVKNAAGVNIEGSITYTLDKGGVDQGNDAVFDPETLSAGFAGKTMSAGSSLTVSGTQNYYGVDNAKTVVTSVKNLTGASLPSTATADNTLSLTLTPEDGFSFVPSKVSFQGARFGTDGGKINLTVSSGSDTETLVDNKDVTRGGKGLDIASFSEEVSNITATADNPLVLNFSFLGLGNDKEMGIANLVIEGQLVGAATQVTKYVLTTQVLPSAEAGSITREPELEQYKEGATVTLKATKNFGYRFKEWQDATGAVVSTDATTTVTMDAEKTMKAVFEAVPTYKVTTNVVAKDSRGDERAFGGITLTPNDHNNYYEAGTVVTATANTSGVVSFTNWEDNSTTVERTITVNQDITITANYEVQDFIAVFDASKTANYAYNTTAGYPFSADEVWDNQRNAKSSVIRVSDGSLCYTQSTGTPVVRNRQSVVISAINGLYQNGYDTRDIAWQYQFSTKGFTSASFTADMCAKNAATKQYKALISVDGGEFTELQSAWSVTANVVNPISIDLPADAIDKDLVVIRITGTGDEVYNTSYPFDNTFDGLNYSAHSESGVGNVYILGDAVVEADEVAPVVTSTVPEANATNVSASGRITITFDEKIYDANSNGAVTLTATGATAGETLNPSWSSRSVSFDYSALSYDTEYTFSMPANYVQDKSGNKYAEAVTFSFTTMQRPTVTKELYDFIVPDNGTITEALAAANNRTDKNTRFRVFIKNSDTPYVFDTNGTTEGGDGQTYPDPRSYLSAANTSFIGESIEGVVITNITPEATWNNGFGSACPLEGIGKGDVLIINGSATDSYFQNLTLKSSMGDSHGRDIVLHDYATRTIFKDACLWAYQDTYVSNQQDGAYYFEGGVIRGRTDFICGNGDAFFNKVNIIMCEKGGYIVAPQGNSKYGYVFNGCTISGGANDVDGTYYLGRAWTSAAETYFINTTMEVQPAQAGWHEWNNGPTRFAEYNSVTANGAVIDLDNRARTINGTSNEPILTAEEAATIGDMANTFGDWQPTLLTEQAPVPTNVVLTGSTLTWDDSDYALLYAICKNGNVIDFTTDATYNVDDASATWTIRAANEMGGLSEQSEEAVVAPSTVTIQMNSAGIMTYASEYNLDFAGSGLTAYVCEGSEINGSELKLTMTAVDSAPATTGLMLKGEKSGSFTVNTTAAPAEITTNKMVGVIEPTYITPEENDGAVINFILANGKHGVDWYTLSEAGNIAANRAYLQLDRSEVYDQTGNARTVKMAFDDVIDTGIDSIQQIDNLILDDSKPMYNVAGQRVGRSYKGIVIQNGKKVIK
ncbi:MAG: Ig-like domain-containing protein [Prevotella sp.]|nr:Ig-like domain-containing protein [Prevotella sp.]